MKKAQGLIFFILFPFLLFGQVSSDKLIREGINYHDQGKYMEAISSYQQALKANPASMSAVYEMSLSYLKLEDYANAIKFSTQVINMGFEPLLIDAYVVKGTALAAQGNLDKAITLFADALKKCGDAYLLHYNLGLCYYNNKNLDQALTHLEKAIDIDRTHSGAFLLYAYALNDAHRWIQSFYSFHFFLLLEPNTKRAMDAFGEMYGLISTKLDEDSERLQNNKGLDRKAIYDTIQKLKPLTTDKVAQYNFFVAASKEMFGMFTKTKPAEAKGLFWDFFVPTYEEILESGHFETYCRYVSVSYFKESLDWWNTNKTEVDNFIEWFEKGQSPDADADEYVEGDE